jgi:subtilisin family serine protease
MFVNRGLIILFTALVAFVLSYWFGKNYRSEETRADDAGKTSIASPTRAKPRQVFTPQRPKSKASEADFPEVSFEALADLMLRKRKPLRDVVVGFSSPEKAAAFALEAPARGIDVIDESGPLATLRIRLRNPSKAAKMLDDWKKDTEMEWNQPVSAPPLPRPEYLEGEKGFAGEAADWMDVPEDRSEWGRGVKVAVLDSGVDGNHPSLTDAKLSSIDLVGGSNGPDGAYLGHGTAIASLIAGTVDGSLGIAPEAEILSIRVLDGEGSGDSFTVARGIVEAADRGADVINLSLGSDTSSQVLQNAVNYAREKGALVVAAVGNDGTRGVTFPARYEGVIGVTSVDAKGRQSAFANYGEGVDIAAPGVEVYTAWSGDDLVSFSGTSSSAGFVSGALAAEISRNPGMTSDQVVDLLYDYANEAEKPGPDILTGKGILNVGRIENRKVDGIQDAAVVGYYFDPAELKGGTTPFLVNVQNQGTAWLNGVSLEVEYGGLSRNFLLGSLDPGEVHSEKLFLDAASAADAEGVSIKSKVTLSSGRDAKPVNDVRTSRITLPSPSPPSP